MKKLLLFFSLILINHSLLFSQVLFERVIPLPPSPQIFNYYTGLAYGEIKFADIDNDNDLDMLSFGKNEPLWGSSILEIYINNGDGNFILKDDPSIEPVMSGSVNFLDVDNDNDLDIFITGYNGSENIAKLYKNDGSGNFIIDNQTTFESVRYSSVLTYDFDNDGDLDILVSGMNDSNQKSNKLYKNDGNGNFTPDQNFNLLVNSYGIIKLADVNGDNYLDLLFVSNTIGSLQTEIKLFLNDGNGNFNLDTNNAFNDLKFGAVAFADIDNDVDLDLLITGRDNSGQIISNLYKNDGSGLFSLVINSNIDSVCFSALAFNDIDGDNDLDLFITGKTATNSISKLYINDGNGNFTVAGSTSFIAVSNGSVSFNDIDNDGDDDLTFFGETDFNKNITEQYINDGNGNFTLVSGIYSPFVSARECSVAYADIDGDNDQDVLICGAINKTGVNKLASILYKNDGNGYYTLFDSTSITGIQRGAIAFGFVNNDNNPDLIITGQLVDGTKICELYINDGNGNYSLQNNTPFTPSINGDVKFKDVDEDGDEDILISGMNSSPKLYINDGNGNYTTAVNTPFITATYSTINFVDFDNDNDYDVFITGMSDFVPPNSQFNIPQSVLYENDGNGKFSISDNQFEGVFIGSVAFGDVNGNGFKDLLLTGLNKDYKTVTKLYLNNGDKSFNVVDNLPFDSVMQSSVAIVDFDNDNDQDVFISGFNQDNTSITKLYTNNGKGNFNIVKTVELNGVKSASNIFFDIDNDNDFDLLIAGYEKQDESVVKLYRNVSCFSYGIDSHIAKNYYTWMDGNTYYMSNNEATYTLKDQNNCDSIVKLNLIITDVKLYPNPSTGQTNLYLGNLSNVDVFIYDINGKIVFTKKQINTPLLEFDLRVVQGVYLVSIISNKEKINFKLVIH